MAVLLSGRGSTFVALADACARGEVPAEIVLVLSIKSDAAGLERARERRIAARAIPSKGVSREEHEGAVVAALEEAGAEWVCLAGYMRLLSASFIGRFSPRMCRRRVSTFPRWG